MGSKPTTNWGFTEVEPTQKNQTTSSTKHLKRKIRIIWNVCKHFFSSKSDQHFFALIVMYADPNLNEIVAKLNFLSKSSRILKLNFLLNVKNIEKNLRIVFAYISKHCISFRIKNQNLATLRGSKVMLLLSKVSSKLVNFVNLVCQ